MVIGITGGSGGGKTTVSMEFEKAGFKIAMANEFDKTIWATYEKNHKTPLIRGDIRNIKEMNFNFRR